MSEIREWIGRSEEARDVAEPGPIRRLAALLDHEALPGVPGGRRLGHWLYFLPEARESDLGPDGHPARGGFLPPVALPPHVGRRARRLSRLLDSTRRRVTRLSTIIHIVDKSGSVPPDDFRGRTS